MLQSCRILHCCTKCEISVNIQVISVGGGKYGHKIPPQLSSTIFSDVQKCARDRLEKKWIPIFMRSPEFRKRHADLYDLDDKIRKVCV